MSKIFIIAGEASGDNLGAKLISEIKRLQPDAEIYGIGGKKMEAKGLKSIFPMQEISLMGITEILPHLPNLLKRLKQTENKIREIKPDVVVTIDSPGFSYNIAKRVKGTTKLIHYVAPTVWAWKPGRAAKIAKLYDHLLVILPFEPPYFENEGLATTYIGHPITEDNLDKGNAQNFKQKYHLDEFLCMMPGSRKGELKYNLPIYKQVAENIGLPVVIVSADYVRERIEEAAKTWKVKTVIIDNSEKADCFAACKAGVIKSGTSALEFAFALKPYVVTYKLTAITHMIVKRLVKVQFANLLNIIAGKELVKELLQENSTAEKITTALIYAMQNTDLSEYRANLAKLNVENNIPSANAAKKVVELIAARH